MRSSLSGRAPCGAGTKEATTAQLTSGAHSGVDRDASRDSSAGRNTSLPADTYNCWISLLPTVVPQTRIREAGLCLDVSVRFLLTVAIWSDHINRSAAQVSDIEEKPAAGGDEPPAVSQAAPATKGSRMLGPRIVLGAFLLAGLGALGIYLALRPNGEPVAEMDLLDSAATVSIDGAAGDSVTFVSRITTGLGAYNGSSWKSRSNDATRAMKASTLNVVVVGPDGAEQTSRCPLWGGSMSSDRPNDEHLTENGVINDCAVDLRSAGKHTVRASVEWDRTLAIKEAQLTVYRDSAGK